MSEGKAARGERAWPGFCCRSIPEGPQLGLGLPDFPWDTSGVDGWGWVVSRIRTHFLWTRACADPMLRKTMVRKLCLVLAWTLIL